MSDGAIDLLVFDLGRVLVDFDFQKVISTLGRSSSLDEKQIRRYFETTPLWDQFEKGRVDPAYFFQTLKKDLAIRDLSYTKFVLLWNNIFTEKHDTVEILRQLRGRYRMAMLSNVNIMHWEHIRQRHAFMSWFDYPVASYAVGYRKPDTEIFRLVLRQANVPPQRAVFIDDIPAHVNAARSIGMRAFQFIDARQLRADLAEIL